MAGEACRKRLAGLGPIGPKFGGLGHWEFEDYNGLS